MDPKKKPKNLTFGQIAIAYNFVKPEQVLDCVIIQKKMKELGVQPKKLGEIMVEKDFISQEQADTIYRALTMSAEERLPTEFSPS